MFIIFKSGDIILIICRDIEDDVFFEIVVLGCILGCRSVYILIILWVIGFGIFVILGSIVSLVGSIGFSFIFWVVGVVLSWFGLVVGLEYGCMFLCLGGKLILVIFNNSIFIYICLF